MAELQGIATFPGVQGFIDATIPITDGISPSVFRLRIPPQDATLPETGTLRISFGDQVLEFIDCKVDFGTVQIDESGKTWEFSIFDRRWKWKFGAISGHYNVRNPDGSIIPETSRTLRELASLCFREMGEEDWYDALYDSNLLVEVDWDFVNPSEALAQLCELSGYRICPRFDERFTGVFEAGLGKDLPSGGIIDQSLTLDSPAKPEAIGVMCGKTRFEVELTLRAVGQDNDKFGTIRPIDDLQYEPYGGWEKCTFGFWPVYAFARSQLGGEEVGKKALELAERSVWRWYQVVIPDGGLEIPGYDKKLTSLRQLELEDTLVSLDGDNQAAAEGMDEQSTTPPRRRPCYVEGTWFRNFEQGNANYTGSSNAPVQEIIGEPLQPQFTIDAEHRMVVFANPIYKNIATDGMSLLAGPAELKLITCVTIRDPETGGAVRQWDFAIRLDNHKRVKRGKGGVANILWLKHEECVCEFRDGKLAPGSDAIDQVYYYISRESDKYKNFEAATAHYVGLIPIYLDGAIRQVTYEISERGTTTSISLNTERYPYVMPWQQRRALEKQRDALVQAIRERQKAQVAKR